MKNKRVKAGWTASILALSAAAEAAPPPPVTPPAPVRVFVSPIGEPFHAKSAGEDPVLDWFRQVDRDGDGALRLDEFQADADRFFETLDRNRDGELDPDEIARYEREVAPEIQLGQELGGLHWGDRRRGRDRQPGQQGGGGKKDRGSRDPDGLQGAGRFSWLNIPEPVAAADADLNRGVSRAELRNAAADRFRLLDVDGDGAIRMAELPRLPEQRGEAEKKAARKAPKRVEGIPLPPE